MGRDFLTIIVPFSILFGYKGRNPYREDRMAAYYLASPDGKPLSIVRYPTTEDAYDACESIYGEGAWNDTVLLCEEAKP